MVSIFDYYNDNAKRLFSIYQSMDPESLHSAWSFFMPTKPGLALDVGGGSGRDSSWLAGKGWHVIAVEPATELMKYGRAVTRSMGVTWIDDSLPELSRLGDYRQQFRLILVGGVLMHLSPEQRAVSLKTLAALMAHNSVLVVTLRRGPDFEERDLYCVSSGEVAECAEKESLQIAAVGVTKDKLGRPGVEWETVVIIKN